MSDNLNNSNNLDNSENNSSCDFIKNTNKKKSNGLIKMYLIILNIEKKLKKEKEDYNKNFENLKNPKNWWKNYNKLCFDIKDRYYFTIQKLGICESEKYDYVVLINKFLNNSNNSNNLNNLNNSNNLIDFNNLKHSNKKNKKNKFFDFEKGYNKFKILLEPMGNKKNNPTNNENNENNEIVDEEKNKTYINSDELFEIEQYLKNKNLKYSIINIERNMIESLENINGVNKILHVSEICNDFYPCKHTAKFEDINKNEIIVINCCKYKIKILMEKHQIKNQKMVCHFFDSYEDFYGCDSGLEFDDIVDDPFDLDTNIDDKNNDESFHFVEVLKETGHVINVIAWGEDIDRFISYVCGYFMKLIKNTNSDDFQYELEKIIIDSILLEFENKKYEHIDILDELTELYVLEKSNEISFSKSYEVRFRNKKICKNTIIL